MPIPGDNPIRRSDEDAIGRTAIARAFAEQVIALDVSQGAVVGVLGPWGHGKTSFVNLARERFAAAGVEVLDFNPWMFSGAEQLVESFFIELAAQLKLRPGLAEIAADLASYGDAFSGLGWLPVAGPWIERARGGAKAVSKLVERRKEGVSDRRARLIAELTTLERPLVVVLDDIDRLTTQEIRDIFRLVRLTASFPNIVYVLAFDRARVETALAEQGIPGRDYLEKILQVAIDLPPLSDTALTKQTLSAINAAFESVSNPGPFDHEVWPDVFMEVIRPHLKTMRDVRRYAMGIRGTVEALNGEIALADVLGLEAIRIFMPDVFTLLQSSSEALTATTDGPLAATSDADRKTIVQALMDAAGGDPALVRAMLERLFPAASRHFGGTHYGEHSRKKWLRERRVAHKDVLLLYLERIPGEAFAAFTEAERAWELMNDRVAFDDFFRTVDATRREDVIAALETFEGEFARDQVVPGVIVLLNVLPDLPERRRGMLDLEPRFVVGRVVYRLLRSLDDQADVEECVEEALPHLNSLSSKFELITDVGYRENAGHKLVAEASAARFEREWLEEVRSATPEALAGEWELLRVAFFARQEAEKHDVKLVIPDDPRVSSCVRLCRNRDPRPSETVPCVMRPDSIGKPLSRQLAARPCWHGGSSRSRHRA